MSTAGQSDTPGKQQWMLEDHERRLTRVEQDGEIKALRADVNKLTTAFAVQAEQMRTMASRIRLQTASMWTIAAGLVLILVTAILRAGGVG